MGKKLKGISLIVLVITIVIIIILAGTVILSLSQNNPIESARQARFKSDITNYTSELTLFLSREYTASLGSLDLSSINSDKNSGTYKGLKLQDIITSMADENAQKFIIQNAKLVYTGNDTTEENWCDEQGISVYNVYLTNLVAEVGGLNILNNFNSETKTYNASVSSENATVTITPTSQVSGAIIKVNGVTVNSGSRSQDITLNFGGNTINVDVIKGDKQNRYTINLSRNSSSYLSGLVVKLGMSTIPLNAAFDKTVYNYSATVASGALSIKITPTAEDTDAIIKVNGTVVSSGAAISIALTETITTVEIQVIPKIGAASSTYTVVVTKT